jgi:accessory colonization factor AcfC
LTIDGTLSMTELIPDLERGRKSGAVAPSARTTSAASTDALRVVGPGGPYLAMTECADSFRRDRAVAIEVLKAPPSAWRRAHADVIYGGFPAMLTNFATKHPDVLDPREIKLLYERHIGLLVRPGNPRHLHTLADLGREGIRVLEVRLERMEQFHDQVPGWRQRVATTVLTGEEGLDAWQTIPDVDAWVTFETWCVAANGTADFVPLSATTGSTRPTVVAVTCGTRRRAQAVEFVTFLQSPMAHEVFRKWGWR